MPLRFTVLGSGSAGNASLLDVDGLGLLFDAGLGPRQLAARMAESGSGWRRVHAVLLTHTHRDHWCERTIGELVRRRIVLYCHADHRRVLRVVSPNFAELEAERLVRCYESDRPLVLSSTLRCRPIAVRHDSQGTFAFRFEGSGSLFGRSWAMSYAADLGSWDDRLADSLAEVDLLALEFNHDVALEANSGRFPWLIARVLSDHGHLSNVQAAGLLGEIVRRSTPGRLTQLVQLHLSRECNRPDLAARAARYVLRTFDAPVQVHTACQERPSPTFFLGMAAKEFYE